MAFPDRGKERALGIFLGLLVSCEIFIPDFRGPGPWLGGALLVAFAAHLFSDGKLEERYQRLGRTLLGALYVGYLVPHLILVFESPYGREWIFFILLVMMSGDTAGYFVGTRLGEKKLAAGISPAKTVEGAVGSIGASLIVGTIGGNYLLPSISKLEIVLLSLVLNILGQTGDLFESWVKRVFAAKDSSNLLPGHGGLLDRLDSLIFPFVFTAYYLRLLHS